MDEWVTQKAHIDQYYNSLIDHYGHDPRACDYGSKSSQQIKFSALSQVMPLTGQRILDVGCGFADFGDFLREKYHLVEYYGIDLTARMIEEARKLHPDYSLRVG